MTHHALCRSNAHHTAITTLHQRAVALHADIAAEREACYPDGVPVAVQVVLDLADDSSGYLCNALDVLSRELHGLRSRQLNPVKEKR